MSTPMGEPAPVDFSDYHFANDRRLQLLVDAIGSLVVTEPGASVEFDLVANTAWLARGAVTEASTDAALEEWNITLPEHITTAETVASINKTILQEGVAEFQWHLSLAASARAYTLGRNDPSGVNEYYDQAFADIAPERATWDRTVHDGDDGNLYVASMTSFFDPNSSVFMRAVGATVRAVDPTLKRSLTVVSFDDTPQLAHEKVTSTSDKFLIACSDMLPGALDTVNSLLRGEFQDHDELEARLTNLIEGYDIGINHDALIRLKEELRLRSAGKGPARVLEANHGTDKPFMDNISEMTQILRGL